MRLCRMKGLEEVRWWRLTCPHDVDISLAASKVIFNDYTRQLVAFASTNYNLRWK